jgi:hypothetical protein
MIGKRAQISIIIACVLACVANGAAPILKSPSIRAVMIRWNSGLQPLGEQGKHAKQVNKQLEAERKCADFNKKVAEHNKRIEEANKYWKTLCKEMQGSSSNKLQSLVAPQAQRCAHYKPIVQQIKGRYA